MKKILKRSWAVLLVVSLLMSLCAGAALAESAYVKTEGKVHVRKGPGLDYGTLGTVEKGTHLTFRDATSTDDRGVIWYKVKYNSSHDGWVSSKYASLHNYDLKVTATDGQTYIRSAASLNGSKLGVLHKGDSATYLNKSELDDRDVAWYYVSYEGKKGWVSSRYTKLDGSSASSRKVTASGGKTNIRTSGNLDAESLGVLPKGASAIYLGETTTDIRGVDWYRINYNGTKGWVSSKYTKLEGAPASSIIGMTEVVASGGKTNIRLSGSLDADSMGVLPKGATAAFTGDITTDDRGVDWYRINYNGVRGWVSSRYTELR